MEVISSRPTKNKYGLDYQSFIWYFVIAIRPLKLVGSQLQGFLNKC